jgi:hypothetical protein
VLPVEGVTIPFPPLFLLAFLHDAQRRRHRGTAVANVVPMTRSTAIDAPTGWTARSLELFYEPGNETSAEPVSNIVVTEYPRRPGESLQAHVRRQLLRLKAADLPDLDIGASEDLRIDGCDASRTNISWRGEHGRLEHLLVHVERPEAPDTMLTFTLTVVPGVVEPLDALERMLANLRPPPSDAPREPAARNSPRPLRSGFIELDSTTEALRRQR